MEVVRLYTVMLCKCVLPSLYPRLVSVEARGMGKGELRAFVNDLLSAISAMFTEGGLEALAKAESARVIAEALETSNVRQYTSGAAGRGGGANGPRNTPTACVFVFVSQSSL